MEARIRELTDFYLPMFLQKADFERAAQALQAEVQQLKQKLAAAGLK